MEDLRKHFEHELQTANIPYKSLADKETLNAWFEQFRNAPKIPSFYLYSRKHLTDDEYVNALENNIRLLGKIKDEFHEHLSSRTLDEQYYINDITKTSITKTLYKVSEIRDIFLNRICHNSVDRYKKPKAIAKDIIRLIEQLPLAFASAIIQNIENEDIDMCIFIMNEYGGENLNREKEYKLKEMNYSLIQHLDKWLKIKSSNEPQATTEEDTVRGVSEKKRTKFIASEYALAYIFDLWANGEQIPSNRVEGGNAYNELLEIGKEKGFERPDTFYRAILRVCKYDLNSEIELERISVDWVNAVKTLSKDWSKVARYLKEKGITAE